MATALKTCCKCGQDVSTQKRTKDTAGRYYCQPCYERASKPEPVEIATKCQACGAAIAEDAAFCARCGHKQSHRLSVSEEIDTAALINQLRVYAEASATLASGRSTMAQAEQIHRVAVERGDRAMIAEWAGHLERGREAGESCLRDCREAQAKLKPFGLERVVAIRKMILDNPNVEEEIKRGLTLDPLGLFGPPASTASISELSDVAVQQTAAASAPPPTVRSIYGRNAIICGCICALSFILIFTGESIGDGVAPLALAACVITFGLGLFAISKYTTASPDELVKPSVAAPPPTPKKSNAVIASTTGTDRTPDEFAAQQAVMTTLGFAGLLGGGFLMYWGGSNVYHGVQVGPETGMAQIVTGAIQAFVGLFFFVGGTLPFQNACPACKRVSAAQLIDATLLDRQQESQTVDREDKHYDANYRYVGSTKRQEQKIVTTDTTLKRYCCKYCGHEWETVVKTQS